MNIITIIKNKCKKQELTNDELNFFVKCTVDGCIDQYQIGAMLMALYLNNMTNAEVLGMTVAMANSGKMLQFRSSDTVVDKHSTGGVGDKVSIPLVPALKAAQEDLIIPMISGRGLGFTGGTLDKLESIPGFSANCLDYEQLLSIGNSFGCFIIGSSDLSPADSILYKARDVTSTIDNNGLIITSIISKKLAAGIKYLVLDLKVGSASFFHSIEEAKVFGKQFVIVAKLLGIESRVLMTRMSSPIGNYVGNSLEILESINCLKGKGPSDLHTLVETIGGHLLEMTHKVKSVKEGRNRIVKSLNDGTALEKFKQMLIKQKVDENIADELCYGNTAAVLPMAKYVIEIKSPTSGYVKSINGIMIAEVCQKLGAGRQFFHQDIDPAVGVHLFVKIGDYIKRDNVYMVLYHNEIDLNKLFLTLLQNSIELTNEIVKPENIIIGVIDCNNS
ncbi:Pyrimidine-nucleoside phosphorylase, conserved site,Glycosyl transferase family 3, N-terminal [Cinara cedri]|uniref:Thymidine phosphorylase n=1 Tax=Cinara cedri TaxID=506608 RepID=A0A5E4NBC3_9HEMI|nr:Pyrimidine-nucleoside phosphorylase, conserved site,Glycosyl transferase family 3, N-terminal [Cinara cedri]